MTKTFEKLTPEKQKAILDAAAKIFALNGYYQANVAEICQEAGISNGALYKYFKNKEELFISVFSSHIDRLQEQFNNLIKLMETQNNSFFEMIEDILKRLPAYIEAEKHYIRIYQDLGSASMAAFTTILTKQNEENSYKFWKKVLEKGKQLGEIRKDIDTNVAAYMVDNHFMLLNFSCLSEHHSQRYNVYFSNKGKTMSMKAKTDLLMRSLKQLLT